MDGIIQLSYATSGAFSPIGAELASIIIKEREGINEQNQDFLITASIASYTQAANSSKAIAQVYYELYNNNNAKEAINILKKNKALILKELSDLKRKKDNSPRIAKNIFYSLDRIIYDLWINEYGDKPGESIISDQAYELSNFFESLEE